MFEVLKSWFFKYFGDPEAAILLIFIAVMCCVILLFGKILAPLLAGIVLAYLLNVIIEPLQAHLRLPRGLAVAIVYVIFIGLLIAGIITLLPLLYQQILELAGQLPQTLNSFHAFLLSLPMRYPGLVSPVTVENWVSSTNFNLDQFADLGTRFLSTSVVSLPSIFSWLIYLFLVPLLALFFLKDKSRLMTSFSGYMPDQKGLIIEVAKEMRLLLGRYVRGKVLEVILVTIFTYAAFYIFKLNYALLLAFLVGLSAVIPYVGAIVVTVPVMVVGLLQWGGSAHFWYMMLSYVIIQVLDGNLLVPILFSEAVNLHPVVIITAVLFFGGIWGFWGLFFAIPLATLVKAVINAWIRHANSREEII